MEDGPGVFSYPLLDPDSVAATRFSTSFRGYSPDEVRQLLERVAADMRAAAEREARLRRELDEVRQAQAHPELDETAITTALGDHAARLIASARESATAIRAEAEEAAAASLREVESRVARARHEAESLMARRLEEAEEVANELRRAAEVEVRALRDQARAEAGAIVQAARSEGRDMVAQARAVRERMLSDLSRRKRRFEADIAQLSEGRDRLKRAYEVVARTLDEATSALRAAQRQPDDADEAPRHDPRPTSGSQRRQLTPSRRPAAAELTISAAVRRAVEVVGSSGAVVTAPPPATAAPEPCVPTGPPPARRPQSVAEAAPPVAAAAPLRDETDAAGGATEAVAEGFPVEEHPASRPPVIEDAAQAEAEAEAPADEPVPAAHAETAPADVQAEAAGSEPAPEPARSPDEEASSSRALVDDPEPGVTVASRTARPVADLFARIRAQGFEPESAGRHQETAEHPSSPPPSNGRHSSLPPEERSLAGRPDDTGADRIADEAALSRRDALLEPVESSLVRALKMALQDAQNELLDGLRRARGGVPEALPSHDLVKRLQGRALAPLEQALLAGAAFAGVPSDDVAAAEPAARLAGELGRQIGEPLAERITALVAETGAGEDQQDLAKRVSSVFRQWKTRQIESAACHQAALAFATGQFEATPSGTPQRWIVDDEVPCPDCDDDALAGAVSKGTPFPTGRLHPPSHHGCRCLLVPVVP